MKADEGISVGVTGWGVFSRLGVSMGIAFDPVAGVVGTGMAYLASIACFKFSFPVRRIRDRSGYAKY
jgi:hypothetical protein